MKKYAISIVGIAGAIVGIILIIQSVRSAQEVPKLTQGMPYAQARKTLINAGWQAVNISIMQRGDQLFGTTKYIVKDLGYSEVVDCSGTGLGLCRFEFAAADGRKLIVTTANNDPRVKQPVILYRWWIEKGR